jgi:hypothetical protein
MLIQQRLNKSVLHVLSAHTVAAQQPSSAA